MLTKRLNCSDFKIHEEKLYELFIEIFSVNFNLTKEKSIVMAKEKLQDLYNFIEDGSAILIGTFQGNNLIAIVWTYLHNFFGEKRFHISQIAVDTQNRGKGIAKQLIKEVEKQALKEGINTIDLFVSEDNTNALKLYKRLGFETERRYMRKEL